MNYQANSRYIYHIMNTASIISVASETGSLTVSASISSGTIYLTSNAGRYSAYLTYIYPD